MKYHKRKGFMNFWILQIYYRKHSINKYKNLEKNVKYCIFLLPSNFKKLGSEF